MNPFFDALKRGIQYLFPRINQNFSPSQFSPGDARTRTTELTTAGANGIKIQAPPNGWVEVCGNFSGLTYRNDDGGAPPENFPLEMGDMIPVGPSGVLTVFAPTGSVVNSFFTKQWDFGTGLILAGSRRSLRAIITGPGGLPTFPASQFASVVSPGGAVANQTYTRQTNNIGSLIVNRGGGILYVAETAAKATTAAGCQIQPGAARKWIGPFFYATDAALTFDVQEDLS